jgi:tetratricopeptide (TPR) repeat protein
MRSVRNGWWLGIAAVVVLTTADGIRARADDDSLRNRALALNNVTGDLPIKGEIKTLVQDPNGTRKLLAAAVPMAKEKDQPFKYNGAYILAWSALQLKEYDASQVFFKVCAQQAAQLGSVQKLLQAYEGMRANIEILYLDRKYVASAKLSQEFLETLEKQGVSKTYQALVLRQMVKSLAKEGKAADAKRIVDNLIKSKPDDWRNLEIQAWLQNETGQLPECLKTYQHAIDAIGKDNGLKDEEKSAAEEELRQEMLTPLAKLGQIDEADRIIDKLLDPKTKELGNLEFKAGVRQEAGRYGDAVKLFKQLIKQVGKDEKLKEEAKTRIVNRLHYQLSGVYIDMNQVDDAVQELRGLLVKEPDNASYNNDLGYILADHDRDLPEAEKMIRKALDEDRKHRKAHPDETEDQDNAAYLDSLGWVLFKKKDYQEAAKYLKQASEATNGQHVEILDHLGDVYQALGKKADAVEAWKKAIRAKTSSKREDQRKLSVEKKMKASQ